VFSMKKNGDMCLQSLMEMCPFFEVAMAVLDIK
jgi:hypothetical protein